MPVESNKWLNMKLLHEYILNIKIISLMITQSLKKFMIMFGIDTDAFGYTFHEYLRYSKLYSNHDLMPFI